MVPLITTVDQWWNSKEAPAPTARSPFLARERGSSEWDHLAINLMGS